MRRSDIMKKYKIDEEFLKDLAARLPYGVRGQVQIEVSTGQYSIESGHLEFDDVDVDVELLSINVGNEDIDVEPLDDKYSDILVDYNYTVNDFIPYLRPLSSMTDEEEKEYNILSSSACSPIDSQKFIDWLNEHHFDYRGMIEKKYAIAAPEEIYEKKIENEQ